MEIVIFGATGLAGKQLVNQALYKGHTVRAFGRDVFTADLPKHERLKILQGAVFDEKQVYNALLDCDAVLTSLGGDISGADVTRSLGTKNIVARMKKAGVRRIVAVGGMGSLNTADDTLVMDEPEFPAKLLPVSKEHFKAYEYLKASDLDWTVVCAPDIIDAEATGIFVTAVDHLPTPNLYKVNAGDLALFMLNELEKNEFVCHRVGISN